jgi:hypothetical protein
MPSIFNHKNDMWFLKKVQQGVLLVTKKGKIKNLKTGNWIGTVGSGGYFKISMKDMEQNKIRHMQIHRLVYLVHHGKIPKTKVVDHRDSNKHNNLASNLRILSLKENSQAASGAGLRPCQDAELNPNSKFTNVQVRKCRRLFVQEKATIAELAVKYKVSKTTIRGLLRADQYSTVLSLYDRRAKCKLFKS